MDAVTLLGRARAAGLTVRAEGDRLIVRGPRRAEPLVRALGAHKGEILALLARGSPPVATELIPRDRRHDDGPTPEPVPGVGDRVRLLRPDGGTVNITESWRIDHVVDMPECPLAIFVGRPYASWPLALCRRAACPISEKPDR